MGYALPAPKDESCVMCSYARERTYGEKSVIECRFDPPSTTYRQGQGAQWPEVQPSDWCGKYTAA